MKKSWISAILAVIAFMAVYVALCYMVAGWRLKLEAPAMVYFAASLRLSLIHISEPTRPY